jgi:hypothetical protein
LATTTPGVDFEPPGVTDGHTGTWRCAEAVFGDEKTACEFWLKDLEAGGKGQKMPISLCNHQFPPP